VERFNAVNNFIPEQFWKIKGKFSWVVLCYPVYLTYGG
jgi:hypothetical protein